MVHAKDDAGNDVEDDPGWCPDAGKALRDAQRREEQRHGGKQEAGFLVLESRETGDACDAGPEQ